MEQFLAHKGHRRSPSHADCGRGGREDDRESRACCGAYGERRGAEILPVKDPNVMVCDPMLTLKLTSRMARVCRSGYPAECGNRTDAYADDAQRRRIGNRANRGGSGRQSDGKPEVAVAVSVNGETPNT